MRRGRQIVHRHRIVSATSGLVLVAATFLGIVLAQSGGHAKHVNVVTETGPTDATRPAGSTTTAPDSVSTSKISSRPTSAVVPAVTGPPPVSATTALVPCGLSELAFSVTTDRSSYPSGTDVAVSTTALNQSTHPCVLNPVVDGGNGRCEPDVIVQDYDLYPPPSGLPVYETRTVPCPATTNPSYLQPGRSYTLAFKLAGAPVAAGVPTGAGTFNHGPGRYLLTVVWSKSASTCGYLYSATQPSSCIAQTQFEVTSSQPASTTTTPSTAVAPTTIGTTTSSTTPSQTSTQPSTG